MDKIKKIAIFFMFCVISSVNAQSKKYLIHTVAFYNFENLFDTINNKNKNDDDWLPNGAQNWTSKKYHQKLQNIARVLSEIGTNEQLKEAPTLIGGTEIENQGVLEDLIKEPALVNKGYGIVHFESPDKRGIDVALLYQKKTFKPTSYKKIPLWIFTNKIKKNRKQKKDEDLLQDDIVKIDSIQKRVYTRDLLLVTGLLDGEEIHILVNHWPSRLGGEKKSAPFREAAGKLNRKIMDSLYKINPKAKIIFMGDLNDGVYNKSVKEDLGAKRFKEEVKPFGIYNPFEELYYKGNATIFYRDVGDIFDQIMVSKSLIQKDYSSFQYWKAGIFNKPYMIQTTGRFKGYPLRHSATEVGFSDHFPVYIYLIKEE